MKKFLTVLLALSVVFTYTVGSAFAATVPTKEQEEKLKDLAEDVKGSFAYYDSGYMKADDNAKYLSKTVVNTGIEKIVDKYMADITNAPLTGNEFKSKLFNEIDVWSPEGKPFAYNGAAAEKFDMNTQYVIVRDGEALTTPATYATWRDLANKYWEVCTEQQPGQIDTVVWGKTYTYTDLLQEQYKVERDAAYAALSPDLSNYSTAVKKEIEKVIDEQTTAIEEVVNDYEKTGKTATDSVTAIDGFKTAVKAIEKALDQDTVADDNEKIAEARKAATKALNVKSEAFKEAAEDHYKALTTAQAVSRLDSLDADVDTMVAFFEAKIAATVLDEKNEDLDTAAEVVNKLKSIQTTLESTFNFIVNAKYNDAEFYKDLAVFDEADVLKVYAEKKAADMKALVNADGSYTYHAADVDVALKTALENIDEQTYIIITDNTKKFNKTTLIDSVFADVEKTNNAYYALRKYKADAIVKVTTGDYAEGNWSYDRYYKVVSLQDQATEDILKATTTDAIDEIVEKAQDDMDKILTTAEIEVLKNKTATRLTALGYTGENGVLAKYYDVTVGSKGYSEAIKDDAIDAAIDVFKDAVVESEDKDITYGEIDKIIADNRDKALAVAVNVKSTAELEAQAAALKAQFADLPKEVTIADKDTIWAAMNAFESYLAQPGTKQTDVTNDYLLENAMNALMTLEVKAVKDQIRELPDKITVADEVAIEAARTAYDSLFDTYGNYDDGKDEFGAETGFNYFGSTLNVSNKTTLLEAEEALETAKVKDAADKIATLSATPSKTELDAAIAAYEALSTESKLSFNDELYADLMRAKDAYNAKLIAGVQNTTLKASSSAVKGAITVKWIKSAGYKVDFYEVYKSTKPNSGFGKEGNPYFKTTKTTYKNTKELKKGTRYYYKVRGVRVIDGVEYYTEWSNKAYRIAK